MARKAKTDTIDDESRGEMWRETQRRMGIALDEAKEMCGSGLSYKKRIETIEGYIDLLTCYAVRLAERGIAQRQSMSLDCAEKGLRMLKCWLDWEITKRKEADGDIEFVTIDESTREEIRQRLLPLLGGGK